MELSIKIKPPLMPNYLILDIPGSGKKQDGFIPPYTIPVQGLTKEQAENFANIMKEEFLKHWNTLKQTPHTI